MSAPNLPGAGVPDGAASQDGLAAFAAKSGESWRSDATSSVLGTFNPIGAFATAIITAITGVVSSVLGAIFGAGGSRSGAAGWSAPPPATRAPSGVIASMAYLVDQIATLQSNSLSVGFGTSGNWIKPPKAKRVQIELVGGGGGGGKGGVNSARHSDSGWAATVSNHGCGGGGGGYGVFEFDADDLPDTLVVEIGLGGAGGTGAPGAGTIGGDGHGSRVLRPDGSVLVEVGGGFGGRPGWADAPSDHNKGANGFGNRGSFASGGNGGQGPGAVGFADTWSLGVGLGAVISWGKARLPARAAWPQRGNPGPYSPGGATVMGNGMAGLPGEMPRQYPVNAGPGSGASGGMYNDTDGGVGGRGGHGTYWGSAGGGGGSGAGGSSSQKPGDGGNAGQGAAWFTTSYT